MRYTLDMQSRKGLKMSPNSQSMSLEQKKLVIASSLGTVFEWYDFYLYGYLASVIAEQFFSGLDKNSAFIFALLAFAIGFLFRPLGALIFGRMGDRLGRKQTFLFTITMMGVSTFLVGCLPNYASIGITAPILLMTLRILQGIALGGEYGGASIYVAEFAPHDKRGAYTSWIQATSGVGYFLSISVIVLTQWIMGKNGFEEWGWRIPFLLCAVFLSISLYIRLKMQESPVFMQLKRNGGLSRHPIRETFGQWKNLKLILIALFGVIIAQSVMGFCGNFYAYYFLTQILKIDSLTASAAVAVGLIVCMPCIVFFGRVSDRVGRRRIMLMGCILGALSYFPIYHLIAKASHPELVKMQMMHPVVLHTQSRRCSWQIDLTGHQPLKTACDVAKKSLANLGITYQTQELSEDSETYLILGQHKIMSFSPEDFTEAQVNLKKRMLETTIKHELLGLGYPLEASSQPVHFTLLCVYITYMLILSSMVYAPMAAFLVELFPTRIRYTAMSLPYHLGNGLFGGMMPAIAYSIVAQTGNIYSGLWYPVIICTFCSFVSICYLPETYQRQIQDES